MDGWEAYYQSAHVSEGGDEGMLFQSCGMTKPQSEVFMTSACSEAQSRVLFFILAKQSLP